MTASTEDLSSVDVVILAGGRGTRLGGDVPKPLRPVAGRPFLEHLLDQVQGAGARRIILSLGHAPDAFKAHFAAHPRPGVELSIEPAPLGTGGGLRLAEPLLGETVLAMNGDSYIDADLRALLSRHRERSALLTMLLTRVPDLSRFGGVEIDAQDAVTRFVEKGASGPGLINAGVYVLDRSVIRSIPEGRAVSLEREVFPAQVGRRFFALAGGFPFIDIGTPESYREAHALFGRKRAP